ncbi:MAG: zinc ribbon domain-containing protein [Asgard group archaeon]|nr:zinc ribbon domain-containing protein [Asgard group archaeon]
MTENKAFCSRCGVEVEPHKTKCPLCGTSIQQTDEEPTDYVKKYPDEPAVKTEKIGRTTKQKRIFAWEVVSVTLLIPLLITLFIDLIVTKTVTWSLYPISSLILAWFVISAPLLFPNILPLLYIGETLPPAIFLLVIDKIEDGQINWFLQVGLPIEAVVAVIAALVIIGSIKIKNKGLNIAAFILFGTGLICLGIDFIVTSYIRGSFGVSWSLYVLASTIVIGGFLLYIHYRLMKNTKLQRKLQI